MPQLSLIHIFFLCDILAVGCVAVITIYMFLSGLPAIGKIGPLKFLFGTEWASTASEPKYGILPFVLSSIYGTLGASLIGVPVGLLTAVFLSKAAAPGVRNVVVTAVELLSGIPSVVFGLLGMQVLVPAVAKAVSYTHLDVYKRQPSEQAIFLFQSMMLEDEGFMNEVAFQIKAGVGAAEAMDRVGRRYAAQLAAMKDNAYMQLRSVDILDVTQRITNIPVSYTHLDVYKRQELSRA